MAKINVLDSAVFNRIAAGEVVERPASIVKELVENSIDAGAKNISIEIAGGGIDMIRVSDNGCGIASEDVPLAFMPHATSKIKTVQDLDEIGTLGFRGEALPSIAAVAHVMLTSRVKDADLGYGIEIENGKVLEQGERGCPFGTSICVRNIFGNIPARKKFLAKPSVEQNEIADIVTRFILANENVSFKYTVDGKTVYLTDGGGAEKALYAVYGRETCENTVAVQHSMSDIVLSGYVGKPYYTKHNRTFQTLIVNGRYVVNSDISYCIYECYSDFLMKRQYPFYVLHLRLPNDMVDVNIHPNKLDVKFANLPLIKRLVREGVRAALCLEEQRPQKIEISASQDSAQSSDTFTRREVQPLRESAPSVTEIVKHGMIAHDVLQESSASDLFGRKALADILLKNAATVKSTFAKTEQLFSEKQQRNATAVNPVSATAEKERATEKDNTTRTDSEQTILSVVETAKAYKLIGCLFRTYILVEVGETVYIIDQHAAHERLLFERFTQMQEHDAIVSQALLIPYTYPISHTDIEKLDARADDIRALGFAFTVRGTNLELQAIPVEMTDMDVQSFLTVLMQSLSDITLNTSKLLRERLMQAACKAAVKGDEELTGNELETLVAQLSTTDAPMYCPHGRPIAVRLERKELEKWFKRIV